MIRPESKNDYSMVMPFSRSYIDPVVMGDSRGFRFNALRKVARYGAMEMDWSSAIPPCLYAYLFIVPAYSKDGVLDRGYLVVGAAFFYKNDYSNVKAEWKMGDVWIHPFERRRGHFTRAFADMKKAFGDFVICSPYSSAFKGLMAKRPEIARHAIERNLDALTHNASVKDKIRHQPFYR